MAYAFKLPELGEGMLKGEVATWDVKEGTLLKKTTF